MNEETRLEYIRRMVENLPVLRAKLKLTQKNLGDLIGISGFSISVMESGQRKMTWNTFMSVLPLFLGNTETAEMLEVFGIYTPELEAFLHLGSFEPLTDEELDGVAAAGVSSRRISRKRSADGKEKPAEIKDAYKSGVTRKFH